MSNIRLVEIRRVSTKEQAGANDEGFLRQEESNRRTAERVGATLITPPIVITDVCRENFVDTPEWRTIRALIAEPDVHLVVDMQDRLVGALEGLPILIELKQTRTLLYHSQGVTDPSTLAGQVLAAFTAIFAGNELHTIRHRAQGGKESKRREGLFASAAISLPIGIDYVRTKNRREGRWTYNDKISVVREVYRIVVEEGVRNWAEVARRSGAASNVTVRNMLTNPIYRGWWILDEKRQPGPTPIKFDGRRKDRKKIKRDPHDVHRHEVFRPKGSIPDPPDRPGGAREEALIDVATWDAVQVIVEAKTKERNKPREPPGNTRFVYTSILRCAACGQRMWSRTRPRQGRESGRRDWYACASTQRAALPNCTTKYVGRQKLDAAMDRLFSFILSDERFLRGVVQQGVISEGESFGGQISAVQAELSRATARRTKLLDLYLDSDLPRAELDVRRAKLDEELDRLNREQARLRRAQAVADKSRVMDGLRDALLALHEFQFWTRKQKREFLMKFFPRIEVSKRGVERVHLQPPSMRTTSAGTTAVEGEDPLVLTIAMSWEQLQPPTTITELGLPQKALYTRGDICTVLDLTEHQFNDRLAKGLIPEAKHRHWGKRAWTLDEVRTVLSFWKARELPYRWGLPRKAFYTTGDLAQVLGVGFERIRYLIETSIITDCEGRDEQGHRRWTEAEVERAVEEAGRADGPEPTDGKL